MMMIDDETFVEENRWLWGELSIAESVGESNMSVGGWGGPICRGACLFYPRPKYIHEDDVCPPVNAWFIY